MTQVHGIFLSARAEGDLCTEADGVDWVMLGRFFVCEALGKRRVVAAMSFKTRPRQVEFLGIFHFRSGLVAKSPRMGT